MRQFARIALLACAVSACGGQSAEQSVASARADIDKGKFSDAVVQLKNAIQQKPNMGDARFLMGTALLGIGDMAGALVEFQKADDLGVDRETLHPLIAKTMLLGGQIDKLLAQFDGESVSTPEAKATIYGYLAVAAFGKGQREAADKWVSQALAQDPKQHDALIVRVRLQAAQGKLDAAEQSLDELLKLHPQSSRAHQLRGDLAIVHGDHALARKAYEAAIAAETKNFAARSSLVLSLLAERQLDAAEAQLKDMRAQAAGHPMVRYLSALIALERKNLKEALEQSQAFLKTNPENVRGLQLVGYIALAQGQLELARASLAKAVKLAPEDQQGRTGLARANLAAGDANAVVKVLLPPGVNKEALSWETTVLLGQAYMLLRDNEKAEAYFKAAAKLNPRDTQSRTTLALGAIERGSFDQGLADLRAIAATDKGQVADSALVNVLLNRKDYAQAAKAAQALESKQPDAPFGTFLRGVVEQQRGNLAEARQAFEKLREKAPSYFPAVSALVSMDLREGKRAEARQRIESFVSAQPRDVEAAMLLAQMLGEDAANSADPKQRAQQLDRLAALVKAHPEEASVRLAYVLALVEANEMRKALDAAQEAVAALPGRADLLDILARIQNRMGDSAQAIQTYNKSIGLNPNLPEVHVRLAELYAEQKDLNSAVQSLRKALQTKEDHLPALKRWYELETGRGDLSAALKIARQTQRLRAELPDGWVMEADVLARQKDWSRSVQTMKRALEKSEDGDLAAMMHRVMLTGQLNDEARKFERDWLAGHARDVQFRNYLLNNALLRRDLASAERLCAEIIKIKPDHGGALNNLAWIHLQNKRPEALELALRAVAVAPRRAEFLDTLAQAYAAAGKQDLAIESQRKAVYFAPDKLLHRANLARLYAAAGKYAEAKTELEVVTRAGAEWADLPEVKQLAAEIAKH